MIMAMTVGTAAGTGGWIRSRARSLLYILKTWWGAYLIRRSERAAIIQLHAMSDRDLRDIGLSRSQISCAVRRGRDHLPFTRHRCEPRDRQPLHRLGTWRP